MTPQEIAVNRVQIATDQAWSYASNNIYIRRLLGLPGDGVFARATPEAAAERASLNRAGRALLDTVDVDLLPQPMRRAFRRRHRIEAFEHKNIALRHHAESVTDLTARSIYLVRHEGPRQRRLAALQFPIAVRAIQAAVP